MDFKFQNLLGAPYQGGNLEISGDILLAPVGNRVSQVRACYECMVILECRLFGLELECNLYLNAKGMRISFI